MVKRMVFAAKKAVPAGGPSFGSVKLVLLFLLSFFLSFLFFAPAPAAAETAGGKFPDLEGHWARQSVFRLAALDIFAGYPDGTFRPERPVTRLEAVALIMRAGGFAGTRSGRAGAARGAAAKSPAAGAPEVPAVPWGQDLVRLAVEKEIIPPGMLSPFLPGTPATRAEIAALLARALQLPLPEGAKGREAGADAKGTGGSAPAAEVAGAAASAENGREALFADLGAAPPEYVPCILAVAEAGFLSGYPDGTFRPESGLTRAEAASVLERLLDADWVKIPPGRRLSGWVSGIGQQKGKTEIELTSLEGVQKITPAPDLKCFFQGEQTGLLQAADHRVELILDQKKQAAFIRLLEPRPTRPPDEKITGTVKAVMIGKDSFLQLFDLECRDRLLPLAWDAVVEGKNVRGGFPSLRPETFVEVSLRAGRVVKAAVLDVKKVSGKIESLSGKTLRLAGKGDKWPLWFNYWDRARIVDREGRAAGAPAVGDSVQITYLDPLPDEIEDERVLEIALAK